jgi:hypothetical protein
VRSASTPAPLGAENPQSDSGPRPMVADHARGEDAGMTLLAATSSLSGSAAIVVASLLMIVAGLGKKRLRWRTVECPVCHHPRGSCTCRWL